MFGTVSGKLVREMLVFIYIYPIKFWSIDEVLYSVLLHAECLSYIHTKHTVD